MKDGFLFGSDCSQYNKMTGYKFVFSDLLKPINNDRLYRRDQIFSYPNPIIALDTPIKNRATVLH